MLILITYDVNVTTAEGRKRLRHIAKTCLDYGVRVQNSVFEGELTPAKYKEMKTKLHAITTDNDSVKFYFSYNNKQIYSEEIGINRNVSNIIV